MVYICTIQLNKVQQTYQKKYKMNNKVTTNGLNLEVLTALINSSELEDSDLCSFTCSIGCFHLSFYKSYDNNNVVVEDFGMVANNKFYQLIPTSEQVEMMQSKIDDFLNTSEVIDNSCSGFESTYAFINSNFNTTY